ncbi:MAG TPA: hypothetical protein VMK66_05260 [Myxococcales bacterium]|nr:hypothetical protein [Myxococcales bacterium]
MRIRWAALALCAACASYRLLPLPAGPGPMPVRYEKSRLFFHSQEEDGALARVFAGPRAVLATVAAPEHGVFASADGGATWAFSSLPLFDAVLFGGRSIFAVSGNRVFHSEDRGESWQGAEPGEGAVEALALGPEGALYAGGRGKLYSSADGGRTFRALAPQIPARNWRVRSIVAAPFGLFVSVRGDPTDPRPPQARLQALLGYASTEAVTALALVDSRDSSPRTYQWGTLGDGAYVSVDGGATFRKTGLMLDVSLVLHEGVLYGVAADTLLQAAALIRRHPDLAAAAERHLNGDRGAASTLREACAYPGREELVAGPLASAPVFRTADFGATWSRVLDPPISLLVALREGVERNGWEASAAPAQGRGRGGGRPPPPQHQRSGGRHGGRPAAEGQGEAARPGIPFPRVMLALVDPARLLAHFNSGLQLSGVSNGDAYAPTQAYWDALLAAAAAESEAEGEISLGPGLPDFPQGAAFEILRLDEGGKLRPVPADPPRAPPGIMAYPQSIAGARGQDFLVLAGTSRRGQSWRGGWRLGAP